MRLLLFVLLVFLLLSACQTSGQTTKKIDMYNSSGDMIGTAMLSEQSDGVQVKLSLEGLTPGFHGIHVHEYSECDGPDFISAGNHFNPEGKEHGLMHPKGSHLGDLPNIKSDAGGIVEEELMITNATLLEGKKSLLQRDGTTLIITSEQDDGVTQPSGNSGERIVCGEIKTKKEQPKVESPTDPTLFNEDKEE